MRYVNYFAYGHNTNLGELQKRIPEARLRGAAELEDYQFILEHFSDIVPAKGHLVHGVLWAIPHDKLHDLDYDEDYSKHYQHKIVNILFNGVEMKALTYVMRPNYHDSRPPTTRYIEYIADGYRENRIPMDQLIHALETRLQGLKDHTKR